jgi:hypothetical protein
MGFSRFTWCAVGLVICFQFAVTLSIGVLGIKLVTEVNHANITFVENSTVTTVSISTEDTYLVLLESALSILSCIISFCCFFYGMKYPSRFYDTFPIGVCAMNIIIIIYVITALYFIPPLPRWTSTTSFKPWLVLNYIVIGFIVFNTALFCFTETGAYLCEFRPEENTENTPLV